jgi:hypothetical protein
VAYSIEYNMHETIALIVLPILMGLLFGLPIIGIIKEKKRQKKQYDELCDDEPEMDEIYEVALGKDTIYLSKHEEDAFWSLSIKQRRALVNKQRALIKKGDLIIVDHPDGGNRMITRLEAIRNGLIK